MDRLSLDGRTRAPHRSRDVKSRTMNRFTVYDEDVATRYDYDEEEGQKIKPVPARVTGTSRGNYAANVLRTTIEGRNLDGRIQQRRRDNQAIRGAAGSGQKEIINLITVKNAARAGKESVLKLLVDAVPNLHPIAPKINAGNIEFFLSKHDDAEAVRAMSRRLADKKNPSAKLTIITQRQAAPWEHLRPNVKNIIEEVVQSRYSAVSNSLDLGDFGNEKKFLDANVLCPLFNNAVLVYVSSVISSRFKEIQGLSLKGNRLRSLDFVSTLVYAAPRVVELDLSSNLLTRIDELDRVRGWNVEKLHLENNELISRYSDASSYTSAVHDFFPRVNYLDGTFVNRDPTKLNASEESGITSLLPYRPGFCPDETLRTHVVNFLVEYLNLYDGRNGDETRKQLMNAYDDNATFTFAIHYLPDTHRISNDRDTYSNYIKSSHNILHDSKWGNYRDKIVYKGSMDVAVALSKLPLTNHVKDSFILDFNMVTTSLAIFTLQGIFRDGQDAFKENGDSKFFVRNFVVIPKTDNTLAILSDMLTLTPIGVERMERYNTLLKKAAETGVGATTMAIPPPTAPIFSTSQPALFSSSSPISATQNGHSMPPVGLSVNATVPSPLPSPYDVNDSNIQQAMIKQFSDISHMKPEWSQKCLSDMNWDFEAAGRVFNEMRNNIPPEAFIN